MKKSVILLAFLITTFSVQALEQMTYHLEQVNSIVSKEKYVFVANETGRALNAVVSDGALQTIEQFNTTGLLGQESYVWIVGETTLAYYIKTPQNLFIDDIAPKDIDSGIRLIHPYSTFYYIVFDDDLATIKSDKNKSLSATTSSYKLYSIAKSKKLFKVYHLVPDTYQRPATGQLGTVCLPFTTLTATGADFYEIAYKEVDAQNNPTNITFQLVEGALQAGRPYVFDPTDNEITFTADPTQPVASSPLSVNGLHGTFSTITDKTEANDNNKLVGQYMIYNNQVQLCGLGCSLNPNRAYIVADEVPLKDAVPAPTRKMMVVGEKNQPEYFDPSSGVKTDLQVNYNLLHQLNKVMIDGQLIIFKADKHFNLLGQEL